jgi:hypothetical protein
MISGGRWTLPELYPVHCQCGGQWEDHQLLQPTVRQGQLETILRRYLYLNMHFLLVSALETHQ